MVKRRDPLKGFVADRNAKRRCPVDRCGKKLSKGQRVCPQCAKKRNIRFLLKL